MSVEMRHCRAVINILKHQRLLQIFVGCVLFLASFSWMSFKSFDARTVSSVTGRLVEISAPAAPRRRHSSASTFQRRLFVRIPCVSARLGNHMFAHAALLGLASETGLHAAVYEANDPAHIIRSVFDTLTPVVTKMPLGRVRTVEWPWRPSVYVPPPTNLTAGVDDNEDIQLIGYFQSWRYFQSVEERVRAEFRFRKHVADAAAHVLDNLIAEHRRSLADDASINSSSSKNIVLVGIHVRRSDMALRYQLKRGYTVADRHYIRRAMNYVVDRVRTAANSSTSVLFVVCTDDAQWARHNILSTSFPVVFASSPFRQAAVDLAVLASCDHVITTVGTFSWWAGYLHRPDGITVYYAGYPQPGTEIGKHFQPQDFFPPWWIGLL